MKLLVRGAVAPRAARCKRGISLSAGLSTGLALFLCLSALPAAAQYSSMGLSGLIHMPDARMKPDGTFAVGYTHAKPYSAPYVTAQMLPFLEVTGRYTRIQGYDLSGKPGWEGYGDYKDKSAGLKLRLLPENFQGYRWIPEVSIGIDDFHGTQLFRSEFIAASKRLDFDWGYVDGTLGYGRKRIGGLYGGLRVGLAALPDWALVAEYDRTRYGYDPQYQHTGMAPRRTGALGAALEYRYGPMSLQAGRMHGQHVFNVSFNVPFQQREFVPNIYETGPFPGGLWASTSPRPTAQQWTESEQWRLELLQTLHAEGLRNVQAAWRDGVLSLRMSGERYRYASRGVGRAALIALAYAPLETQRLEITWEHRGIAGITWDFNNVPLLERYFAGTASRAQLVHSLNIYYADPTGRTDASRANDIDQALLDLAHQRQGRFAFGRSLVSLSATSTAQSSYSLTPYLRTYLNDPSGAFKYDVGLRLGAEVNLGRGLWLDGSVIGSLHENISDVKQPSNSLLPHVRSDVAEYRRASKIKLQKLTLNQYWHPATRTYVRASAGIYEEMFAGAGVQALYLHRGGRLAWDVAVDAVRQRDFKGTGFQDYKTVTAIASMHYKLPVLEGVTATVRAGRFLARDYGVRVELSRTFASGIELGAWYSHTNADDITSPGRPGKPYQDKGVFMRIPLGSMTGHDMSAMANFSLSPWARDGGQMVESPDDLYQTMRRKWLDNAFDSDGLRSFSDVVGEDAP
ncbi:MAG TPA: YjbH domain-containing protein [Alcaligenaceae bacterium]|nr:YjbH domain-containing protein [Alcaligenaceae bacterium]